VVGRNYSLKAKKYLDAPPVPSPHAPLYISAYHWDLISHFSKLLQQLDKASQEDPVGIEEAVLDKGLAMGNVFAAFGLYSSSKAVRRTFHPSFVLSAAIHAQKQHVTDCLCLKNPYFMNILFIIWLAL